MTRVLLGIVSTRGRGGRAGGSDGAGPRAVSLFRRISRAFPISLVLLLFFFIRDDSSQRVLQMNWWFHTLMVDLPG